MGETQSYPLYESWHLGEQAKEFLTSTELVDQTHDFLQRFQELISKGQMPDVMFFLDKSARPLFYLFRKLFPVYYPHVQMPQIKFINIGGSGSAYYDSDARPFAGNAEIIRTTYGAGIDESARILIVDEYSATGLAILRATQTLTAAFPQSTVTSMIAYSKLPNWYQNKAYLGVQEYSKYDYEYMALDRLNTELGTTYQSVIEMLSDQTKPNSVSWRFWEIYNQIVGTIPHTKKAEHLRTYYEDIKPGLIQRLLGKTPTVVKKELTCSGRLGLN